METKQPEQTNQNGGSRSDAVSGSAAGAKAYKFPDGEYDYEDMTCGTCWGEGFIVTCCDDLCRGAGYCMHGDGERVCPTCKGAG